MSLQQEILNGESRTLEYKVELPEDSEKWVKSIVAFANGAGGKFVVGVNNRREFIGIPKKADLFELKDSIADKRWTPVSFAQGDRCRYSISLQGLFKKGQT